MRFCRFGDGQVGNAWLHPCHTVVGVDVQNAIEFCQAQYDPVGQRHGAAGQAGTRSARHYRYTVFRAQGERTAYLCFCFRDDNGHRQLAIGGQRIAFIRAQIFRVVQYTLRWQQASQPGYDCFVRHGRPIMSSVDGLSSKADYRR